MHGTPDSPCTLWLEPLPCRGAFEHVGAAHWALPHHLPRLTMHGHVSADEKRNVSDEEYKKYVDSIHAELQKADKELESVLREAKGGAAVEARPGSPGVRSSLGSPGRLGAGVQLVPGDASYLADAMAEELRERLRELARQVADLQLEVNTKDVRIQQLMDQKEMMEKKFGMATGDRKSGAEQCRLENISCS